MGMKTEREQRVFAEIEIRGAETTISGFQFLHGRAVPYNTPASIGYFLEEHEPGSFAKSIKEAAIDLPLLLFHDQRSFPIGAADEWDDNDEALDGIWRLDEDSEHAQRAAQLADKGMLRGMSIGFTPIRSEWTFVDDWDPARGPEYMDRVTRKESRLAETSVVPAGAFKEALVKMVRAAPSPRHPEDLAKRELEAWKRELEALRTI